ncbi:hypothetical protein O9993_13600 [Vibrio lentus]|nr:hypothetical protein [Vibrio lentus]
MKSDEAQENIESDVEIPRATNVVEAMADGAMSDFVLPLQWCDTSGLFISV